MFPFGLSFQPSQDIQEVVGSAIALSVLSSGAIPLYAGVIISAFDCFLILLLDSFGKRKLESVFAVLILVIYAGGRNGCSLSRSRGLVLYSAMLYSLCTCAGDGCFIRKIICCDES